MSENIPSFISDPSQHFDERQLPISLIVVHYTNMGSFDGALDLLTGRKIAINGHVSAHYAISRNGDIYHLVDESKRAWHAGAGRYRGITDVNSASIGIELDNEGDVYFREHGTWPPYTKALISSLSWLLRDILTRYPHITTNEDIIGHNHLAPRRKMDPGPHFPWKQIWTLFVTPRTQ